MGFYFVQGAKFRNVFFIYSRMSQGSTPDDALNTGKEHPSNGVHYINWERTCCIDWFRRKDGL
jgi:hypothetical protein